MDPMSLLIPLIGIGSQFLGSFFGKNDKTTENTNTLTNATTAQTTTGVQNTTTGQSSTQGTDSATSQNSTGTQTGAQTGSTNRLDAGTTKMLTDRVQQLLSVAGGNTSALDAQLTELNNNPFDTTAFVNGIMESATASAKGQTESSINKIKSATGGGSDSNSAAALLEAKINGDMAANLAGIRANATAQGEQIRGQRANTVQTLVSTKQNEFSSAIGSLLNAGEQTSVLSNQNTTQQTAGTSSTDTVATSDTTQNTSQKQNTGGTQIQTQVGTGTSNKNSQDWTTFFSSIGKMFNTTFSGT